MRLSEGLFPDMEIFQKMFSVISYMMLKESKKNSFQNCTKDRMVHFNISVAVKHSRDIKQPRARKLMFL